MVIFPLAPDQTIAHMWSNGARGVQKFRTFHDVSIEKKIAQIGCIKVERLDRISFDALLTVTSTDSNGRLKFGSARANSSAGL